MWMNVNEISGGKKAEYQDISLLQSTIIRNLLGCKVKKEHICRIYFFFPSIPSRKEKVDDISCTTCSLRYVVLRCEPQKNQSQTFCIFWRFNSLYWMCRIFCIHQSVAFVFPLLSVFCLLCDFPFFVVVVVVAVVAAVALIFHLFLYRFGCRKNVMYPVPVCEWIWAVLGIAKQNAFWTWIENLQTISHNYLTLVVLLTHSDSISMRSVGVLSIFCHFGSFTHSHLLSSLLMSCCTDSHSSFPFPINKFYFELVKHQTFHCSSISRRNEIAKAAQVTSRQ